MSECFIQDIKIISPTLSLPDPGREMQLIKFTEKDRQGWVKMLQEETFNHLPAV